MRTLHKAAVLLGLLLPAVAIAGDQVAPVSETVRANQDQAGMAGMATPAGKPVQSVQPQAPAAAAAKAAAYVPKTAYDNSPYRFNAGARFTAAEFDAWMKSRGIRVAKGKPAADSDATVGTDTAATANASDNSKCNTQSVSAC